jgi:hypothetical protein
MSELYFNRIQQGIKCTNSYWSSKETLSQLEKSNVLVENQPQALLFIKETRYDFWRLYFYVQDITKINWKFFKEKSLVAEIVVRNSKKEKWDSIIQLFHKNGSFKLYDAYKRYFKETTKIDIKGIDFSIIETSKEKDFIKIQKLIEDNFDAFSDKIPSIDELKILSHTTFLIKDKGQIVAFFITEKKGITLEFRYWLVLEQYRGKKYGSILMKRVLTFDSEIKRITSWISQNNKNVILAHKNQGFKEDGLTNYILYRD